MMRIAVLVQCIVNIDHKRGEIHDGNVLTHSSLLCGSQRGVESGDVRLSIVHVHVLYFTIVAFVTCLLIA
jgi:hypothetical protein